MLTTIRRSRVSAVLPMLRIGEPGAIRFGGYGAAAHGQPHQPRDHRRQQRMHLRLSRRRRRHETGPPVCPDPVCTVHRPAMKVDVPVRRRPEALDDRHRAGLEDGATQSCQSGKMTRQQAAGGVGGRTGRQAA
jgi:hypothetical protein